MVFSNFNFLKVFIIISKTIEEEKIICYTNKVVCNAARKYALTVRHGKADAEEVGE